jgi:hypothetical protein
MKYTDFLKNVRAALREGKVYAVAARALPADQLLALLLLTRAIVSGCSVHWSCRDLDSQRAAASALSRVLR